MELGSIANKVLIRRGLELREIPKPTVLEHVHDRLTIAEASLGPQSTRNDALAALRRLGLSDFGMVLFSMPDPDFPKLTALLPAMADPSAQALWTGTTGVDLLTRTLDFVRSLSYNFTQITGRRLRDAKILDFGCGYGRVTRLMYYFANDDQVYAVDPWDKSMEACRACGLTRNFFQSEFLPSALPVPSADFDLIFAFSVFTHLSEVATVACLNVLASHIRQDGLVAITIRPAEYWDVDSNAKRLRLSGQQKEKHSVSGFSFLPPGPPSPDSAATYGDTSMRLEWLESQFPSLKIVGTDRSLSDPYQIYVFLQKR